MPTILSLSSPFASILIPAFNAEKFIEKSLYSALNQSFADIEIIVIDDGSADKTGDLVKEMAADPRIKYFYQENKGIPYTRNKALDLALGVYIIFLDADDLLASDFVAEVHNHYMNKDRADLILFDYKEESKEKSNYKICKMDPGLVKYYLKEPKDAAFFLADKYAALWSKAYNLEFIRAHQIRFFNTRTLEDMFFNLDLLMARPRLAFINSVAYFYQYNEASISRQLNQLVFSDRQRAVSHFLEKYKSHFQSDYFISFFTNRILMQFVLCFSRKLPDEESKSIYVSTMSFLNQILDDKFNKMVKPRNIWAGIKSSKTKLTYALYVFTRTIYKISKNGSFVLIKFYKSLYSKL